MIAKTTGNNKKPTKHYREKKLGLIDRLSIALLKKQDTLVKDTEHSPVSNIRRFFGYLIDFMLANIFCVIPLVIIQASLTGSTNTGWHSVALGIYYHILCILILYVLLCVYTIKNMAGTDTRKAFIKL